MHGGAGEGEEMIDTKATLTSRKQLGAIVCRAWLAGSWAAAQPLHYRSVPCKRFPGLSNNIKATWGFNGETYRGPTVKPIGGQR